VSILIVSAAIKTQLAKPGKGGALLIEIFVVNTKGKAVTDLTKENFSIRIVYNSARPGHPEPAYFPEVEEIEDESGLYTMSVFPKTGGKTEFWDEGEYLFRITAKDSKSNGHTLLSVNIV
jgi:hypothetical protein